MNKYDTKESSISKPGTSIPTQYDIEETSIVSQFRTSILLYNDIEDFSMSTNAPSISVSKLLCFDIEFRVLRYRCSFVGSSLGCLLPTGHRLRCAHCIANQSSPVAHAPPGPPSAAAAEAALGGAPAPAAPAAAPAAAAAGAALGRRSGSRSRRSGHQLNAGARDSSRQESTGAKHCITIHLYNFSLIFLDHIDHKIS